MEATFCQNRPQPPQLPRGNTTSRVYPPKNSGAGQTLHHQKAIKGKSRREAICSSQLPSWLISTVFLSHCSLGCVRSHPGDDPRHLSRGQNPHLALQLCWRSSCTSHGLAAQLPAARSEHMLGEDANLLSLGEFIKCHGQGGEAQSSLREDFFPIPRGWPRV